MLALLPCMLACGDLPLSVKGTTAEGVVFARLAEGGSDLARARIADGAVVALTNTPDREESWPDWSELARRLVFQVGPLNGRDDSDLLLWLPRSGQEIPVMRTPQRPERWPYWSPAQQQLAFTFISLRSAGLAVYDVTSRSARVIARAPRSQAYLHPNFSPDGSTLVVEKRGSGGRGASLWLMREGEPHEQLTFEPRWFDMQPHHTRDGLRVVYTRRPAGGGWFEIAQVDLAGGEPRVLVPSAEADSMSARPSPTRDEMLFVSDRGGNFDVYRSTSEGKEIVNLTRTPERDEFLPRWSADGELVLLTVAAHESGTPLLADHGALQQARVVVLTRDGEKLFETEGFMPDWMPPW